MLYAYLAAVCVVAYLIGSIPTGYIIVKLLKGEDIRTIGSGSTGATNVKRVLGKGWFFATMVLDAIKGAVPVAVAAVISNMSMHPTIQSILPGGCVIPPLDTYSIAPVLAAIMVLLGHSKPIFLAFKGGKSVASGVGVLIALSWQTGLIVALIWAVITYITRYVSVGSIIAMVLSPVIMFFFNKPLIYIIYCALGAFYIVYLHRENIGRLIKGEESKVR